MTTKELLNGCKKRMSLEMVLEFQLHTFYKCLIAKKEFPFKDRFNINKMIQLNISSLLIHWNCQEAKKSQLNFENELKEAGVVDTIKYATIPRAKNEILLRVFNIGDLYD